VNESSKMPHNFHPEWKYEAYTGNLLTISKSGECNWSLAPNPEFLKDLSRYAIFITITILRVAPKQKLP